VGNEVLNLDLAKKRLESAIEWKQEGGWNSPYFRSYPGMFGASPRHKDGPPLISNSYDGFLHI